MTVTSKKSRRRLRSSPLGSKAQKKHFQQAVWAGEVLGHYFQEIGLVLLKQNQSLMEKFNIPYFSSVFHGEKPSPTTSSPHLTFNTNGLFNSPHIDKADVSDYAFVLFLPNFSDNGASAHPDSGHDI
ncbi:hypothetical protein VP01_5196g2, partial [Puccinia sorghi]